MSISLVELLQKKNISYNYFINSKLRFNENIQEHAKWLFNTILSVPYPGSPDTDIVRKDHGLQHVARAAIYVPIFANLYSQFQGENLPKLTNDDIKLLQIGALFHDAGREAEGEDKWDCDSAALCYFYLTLVLNVSRSRAIQIAEAIANKDLHEDGYFKLCENDGEIGWQIVQAPDSKSIYQKLIHDPDCADIIRVERTFEKEYLDFYQDIAASNPNALNILNETLNEVKAFIASQGDKYSEQNVDVKKQFEHENGFSTILELADKDFKLLSKLYHEIVPDAPKITQQVETVKTTHDRNEDEELRKFSKTLLQRLEYIAQLKGNANKPSSETGLKITSPLTQTQAYLKLKLGSEFSNDPDKDVDNFINNYSMLKEKLIDPHFLKVIKENVRNEIEHADKTVFYHATESGIGFLNDILTEFRRQLFYMGEGRNVVVLRAFDDIFKEITTLDNFVDVFSASGRKKINNNVGNYQHYALSANPTLFSNDGNTNSSTLFIFHEGKSLLPPNINDILLTFLTQMGVKLPIENLTNLFKQFLQQDDRILYQIFMSDDVVNELDYSSRNFGELDHHRKHDESNSEDKCACASFPIKVLRESPERFHEIIGHDVNTLQTRIFLKPDQMYHSDKVITFKSRRRDIPPEIISEYERNLKQIVEDVLTESFASCTFAASTGIPKASSMFFRKPPTQVTHAHMYQKIFDRPLPKSALEETMCLAIRYGCSNFISKPAESKMLILNAHQKLLYLGTGAAPVYFAAFSNMSDQQIEFSTTLISQFVASGKSKWHTTTVLNEYLNYVTDDYVPDNKSSEDVIKCVNLINKTSKENDFIMLTIFKLLQKMKYNDLDKNANLIERIVNNFTYKDYNTLDSIFEAIEKLDENCFEQVLTHAYDVFTYYKPSNNNEILDFFTRYQNISSKEINDVILTISNSTYKVNANLTLKDLLPMIEERSFISVSITPDLM